MEGLGSLDFDSANEELARSEGHKGTNHIVREDPATLRRLRLRVEPALCSDKDSGAAEAYNRTKDHPRVWSGQDRHRRGRCDDRASKDGIGANMSDPLDNSCAAQRSQCKAREIAAEYQTSRSCVEFRGCHPQGDERGKEAVGELDGARRDDERSDLRSHRPTRLHRPSFPHRRFDAIPSGFACPMLSAACPSYQLATPAYYARFPLSHRLYYG